MPYLNPIPYTLSPRHTGSFLLLLFLHHSPFVGSFFSFNELLPDIVNDLSCLIEGSPIVNDKICMGNLVLDRHLSHQPFLCLCPAVVIPLHDPDDLLFRRYVDKNNDIEK